MAHSLKQKALCSARVCLGVSVPEKWKQTASRDTFFSYSFRKTCTDISDYGTWKKKKNSFTWLYLNKHVVVYRGPTASKTTLITCRNVCGLTKQLQGSSCGYFDARVLAHRRKHATVELWEKNRSLHVFIDVLCCILDSGVFIRTVVRTVSGIFIWLLYSDVHILWKYS